MAIPSSPATFSPSPTSTLTFAIPAGTYSSGIWSVTSNVTGWGGGTMTDNILTSPSLSPDSANHTGNGAWNYTINPISAGQLADINAAAGGNLSVSFQLISGSGAQSVSAFTLTLVGTPAVPMFQLTETGTMCPMAIDEMIAY